MSRFDPTTHTYYDDSGNQLPSVTQIIRDVYDPPQWGSEWHLQRGRANHACYAMVADGVEFVCDPQSEPYVAGCRMFFRDYEPLIVACERPLYMPDYAGTPDLVACIGSKLAIIDYKNSPSRFDFLQMAGYAAAWEESTGERPTMLMSVVINGNGRYTATKVRGAEARNYSAKWRATLAVYNIKKGWK